VGLVFILVDELANKFSNLACCGGISFVTDIEKLISFNPIDSDNQLGVLGFFLVFFLASHAHF
jgi:hypothetical protein